MARRFVDISVPLNGDAANEPAGYVPQVAFIDHKASVGELTRFFPGLAASDLPDAEGWAIESIQLTTHNGPHLDAGRRPSPSTRCRSTGASARG